MYTLLSFLTCHLSPFLWCFCASLSRSPDYTCILLDKELLEDRASVFGVWLNTWQKARSKSIPEEGRNALRLECPNKRRDGRWPLDFLAMALQELHDVVQGLLTWDHTIPEESCSLEVERLCPSRGGCLASRLTAISHVPERGKRARCRKSWFPPMEQEACLQAKPFRWCLKSPRGSDIHRAMQVFAKKPESLAGTSHVLAASELLDDHLWQEWWPGHIGLSRAMEITA